MATPTRPATAPAPAPSGKNQETTFTRGMRVAAASSGAPQSVWVVPPAERRSVAALERQIWVHLSQGPRDLRRLTSGEALLAFWQQSLTTDAGALAVATDVVSCMPAYAVRGQSIPESAELLASLLAGPSGPN